MIRQFEGFDEIADFFFLSNIVLISVCFLIRYTLRDVPCSSEMSASIGESLSYCANLSKQDQVDPQCRMSVVVRALNFDGICDAEDPLNSIVCVPRNKA
jgi:hypothetical protein